MSDADTKLYTTTDFYTAAVLISKKFEVKEVSGDRTKTFHFEDSPELKQIIMAYVNGTLEGNIRVFKNAVENVKDLLHSR